MPERVGPLSILGQKLRSRGPPSLSILIARLGEVEDYEAFLALVREFLPEREDQILHELTPESQVAAFAGYFEDRYFPLDEMFKMGDIEGYGYLTRAIPVIPRGISWDDYHEIPSDWRPGFQLMTYLVADGYGEEEARVALAEACAEHVPVDLLQQVPDGGLSQEECHLILDETSYKALAHWSDILWAGTGNFFLDACYEDIWSCPPDWDREVVEYLTQQWQQAERIHEEVFNLATWLEDDPPGRFKELLNFILERRGDG